MQVKLAQQCGFCPGVRTAIETVEQTLAECRGSGPVYSLGPVIHNMDEVERLGQAGLDTVESINQIEHGRVVIRSHGVSPEDLQRLQERGLEVVDATCILVKRLQKSARTLADDGFLVVIVGEKKHPEIQAVLGLVPEAIVVAQPEDLVRIPAGGKLGIVVQTTQSPEHLGQMLGALGSVDFRELRVINTLCRESCQRQQAAADLCRQVDIMFVLGGLHSANTTQLAQICRRFNPCTYHLESVNDLDTRILEGKNTAGVTAGASTPDRVIKTFVQRLLEW